jgi:hypothetical protein
LKDSTAERTAKTLTAVVLVIPREGVERNMSLAVRAPSPDLVIPREGVESQKAVPRRLFYFNV